PASAAPSEPSCGGIGHTHSQKIDVDAPTHPAAVPACTTIAGAAVLLELPIAVASPPILTQWLKDRRPKMSSQPHLLECFHWPRRPRRFATPLPTEASPLRLFRCGSAPEAYAIAHQGL